MSKVGFPKPDPALTVIPLNHGLESHVTKRRGIAHGHLERREGSGGRTVHLRADPSLRSRMTGYGWIDFGSFSVSFVFSVALCA